jgi:molybdopterin converting factor small subunit
MTDVTTEPAIVEVTVRFFAAAAAAAGSDLRLLTLRPGATIDDAICELSGQSDEMALVLLKCSYLCDGVAVRDLHCVLRPDQTIDVLPPFAGG